MEYLNDSTATKVTELNASKTVLFLHTLIAWNENEFQGEPEQNGLSTDVDKYDNKEELSSIDEITPFWYYNAKCFHFEKCMTETPSGSTVANNKSSVLSLKEGYTL